MLRCPVCVKSDMVVLELEEIEVDHCLSCGGVWLDAGELELLMGAADRAAARDKLRDTGVAAGSRKCPICGKTMEKAVSSSAEGEVTLDRCPAGHGIWFDDGELQAVLACGCGADGRVVALVRDMFRSRITTGKGE